jgi:hypothetical protein
VGVSYENRKEKMKVWETKNREEKKEITILDYNY